jgi:sigma-B regulation protein RsbU (phosphoserine phosphatase)
VNAPDSVARVRILAVDDERTNLAILSRILEQEGYEVIGVDCGEAARREICQTVPQLVLLDVKMPGEDGFDVLRSFQALPGMRQVPVIFLSGVEEVSAKLHGFSLGAVDYIVKPFHPGEIKARVRLHLKLSLATNALVAEQARKLQMLQEAQSRLLIHPESMPAAKFQIFWQPAQEAGGDFYDVVESAQGIHAYFIADVSGHDVGTSLVASAAQALLRQNLSPFYSPSETMQLINGALVQWLPTGRFLSSTLVVVNRKTGKTTIVNAGHLPCLYMSHGHPTRTIQIKGDLMGIFGEANFGCIEIDTRPGDRFLLFTDGLLELPDNSGWEDGYGKLRECVDALTSEPLDSFVARIHERMDNGFRADDTLIMAFDI